MNFGHFVCVFFVFVFVFLFLQLELSITVRIIVIINLCRAKIQKSNGALQNRLKTYNHRKTSKLNQIRHNGKINVHANCSQHF